MAQRDCRLYSSSFLEVVSVVEKISKVSVSMLEVLEYGMIVTIAILRVKISAAVFLALFGSLKVLQRAFCSHAYSGRKDGHFY